MTALVMDLLVVMASEQEWDVSVFGENKSILFIVLELWVFESASNWNEIIVKDWAEF